jgi:uncharacterized protein YceH (UPF0502 family)
MGRRLQESAVDADMGLMEEARRHSDLTSQEVRVLGCLIEKESTTPDNYPLTLNGLRTACNQATSRDPVVSYGDHDVERALASLRERGLTRNVHSTSNRAMKFRHVLAETLGLEPAELAVLSVLMLRGPQTLGELKNRADRQHHFGSTDEVAAVLSVLAERSVALVRRLDRRPGQKDARWVHLMSHDVSHDAAAPPESPSGRAAVDGSGAADVASSADPYGEATAEFYDLLATGHWEAFGLQLLDLLAGVDPSVGPIVDVGAGTGVGLPYLQVAVPAARIHAIEPSRAMRTALHTRLMLDPDLRRVTTVEPRSLRGATLPESACALVASAALGHLGDDERAKLWSYIAERMPPGAPAVIEVLPPDRPLSVPPTRYRRLSVGEYAYEGWQQGEPADERHMDWTMTYRVLHDEELVAGYTVRCAWRCFSVADIRAEIEPFGLTLTEHEDCVVISSPASRPAAWSGGPAA